MAKTHKPFREILKPGANFEFVEHRGRFFAISLFLILASLAMLFVNKHVLTSSRGEYLNWTIDFKGGTEMILWAGDASGKAVPLSSKTARAALEKAGKESFDVSDFTFTKTVDGADQSVTGVLIRTPEFGAMAPEKENAVKMAFIESFKDKNVESPSWSGDRFTLRSNAAIDWNAAKTFFDGQGLELKLWSPEETVDFSTAVEGTSDYKMSFYVRGIDAQYQKLLEDASGGNKVYVENVYGVGAKAGAKLRNDGIKSLFYAMALIMLYLAFRFDIRYAPGAVVALLHDAIIVLGAFALSWQEVSLTTVAALLTVIGYSVNDSVVIFDRIRENVARLKDKKFPRVINVSLNETLSRSILTSLTLFVVTLMMNVFGTGLVANFAFAMNVGVIAGTYSSVFIASPIVLAIHNKYFAKA